MHLSLGLPRGLFPPTFIVVISFATFLSYSPFRSLRTLSIHLSLGLPRGLFPPTFIVVTCVATFVSSLLITWPYHERRFWLTCVVIGLTIESLLNFSFPIRYFLFFPSVHLSMFISVVCILCCSALCSAQHSLPYIKVGLMTMLYSFFFLFTGTFLSQITQDNPLQEFPLIVLFYRHLRHILWLLLLLIPST